MNEEEFRNLSNLFLENTKAAIAYSQRLLCMEVHCNDKFSKFIEINTNPNNLSACQESWSYDRLSFMCKDCSLDENSCICMDCFLHGNHEGHNVVISNQTQGNCDCGDPSLWKESGYCTKHRLPDENPHITQIEPNLRELLISIITAAFCNASKLADTDPKQLAKICKWTKSFISVGDGFRRCVAIAITKKIDFQKLIEGHLNYPIKSNYALVSLFGRLINDSLFSHSFSYSIIKMQKLTIDESVKKFINSKELDDISINKDWLPFFDFTFHAYSPAKILSTIKPENNIYWQNDILYFFQKMYEVIGKCVEIDLGPPKKFGTEISSLFININSHLSDIISAAVKIPEYHDQIFSLFNSLIDYLSTIELTFSLSIDEDRFTTSIMEMYYFLLYCLVMINSFDQASIKYDYKPTVRYLCEIISKYTLKLDTKISIMLSLHYTFADFLIHDKDSVISFLISECPKHGLTVDEFAFYASINPLRILIGSFVATMKVFFNQTTVTKLMEIFSYKSTFVRCILPLVTLIQFLLGLSSKKDDIIMMMASLFTLFDEYEFEDSSQKRFRKDKTSLSYFFLIACLITDKICMENDVNSLSSHVMAYQIIRGKNQIEQINKKLDNFDLIDDSQKIIELQKIADRNKTKNGSIFKLKDEKHFNIFKPWVKQNNIMNLMNTLISKQPDTLLYFPSIIEDDNHLKFKDVLRSSTLHAIIFMTLLDKKVSKGNSKECLHIILNLLIKASHLDVCDNTIQITDNIEAGSIEELIAKMPKDFVALMKTKIKYTPLSDEPFSLVDLIEEYGKLGKTALAEMNLGYEVIERTNSSPARAKAIRDRIEAEYRERQKKFMPSTETEARSEATCNVCSLDEKPDMLCYPVFVYISIFPDIVQGKTAEESRIDIGFRLCNHIVHSSCIQKDSNFFNCPIDRNKRSSLLPHFRHGFEKLSKEAEVLVMDFFSSLDFIYQNRNKFGMIICGVAGTYIINEVRLRSFPDCLDNCINSILLRNIFLLLWHAYRIMNEEITIDFLNPIKTLLSQLVIADDPEAVFLDNAKNLALTIIDDKERFIFLRQAKLVQVFSLNFQSGSFIDWDEVLTLRSLEEEFGIKPSGVEIELQPYTMYKLPKRFIDLGNDEYKIAIDDQEKSTALDILTGKIVDMSKQRGGFADLERHLANAVHGSPTFLMYITGRNSTSCFIASYFFSQIVFINSIYVDDFGDEDIGYQRGAIVKLNQDRLERFTDMMLSGEWSDKFIV